MSELKARLTQVPVSIDEDTVENVYQNMESYDLYWQKGWSIWTSSKP